MNNHLIELFRRSLVHLIYEEMLDTHVQATQDEIDMANSGKVLSSFDKESPDLLEYHLYTLSPVLITAIGNELGDEGLRLCISLGEKYTKDLYSPTRSAKDKSYVPETKTYNGMYSLAIDATNRLFQRFSKYDKGDRFKISFNNNLPDISYYRLGNLENGGDWTLPIEVAIALNSISEVLPDAEFDESSRVIVLELNDYELALNLTGYVSSLVNQFGIGGYYCDGFVLLLPQGNVMRGADTDVLQVYSSEQTGIIWHEMVHYVSSRYPWRMKIGLEEGVATSFGSSFDENWLISNLAEHLISTEDLIAQFNYVFGCDIVEILREMEGSFPEFNAEKFLKELIEAVDSHLLHKEEN